MSDLIRAAKETDHGRPEYPVAVPRRPERRSATLTIEADDGSTFEFEATFEQLELMADELDDILSANDDATEVKEGEEA